MADDTTTPTGAVNTGQESTRAPESTAADERKFSQTELERLIDKRLRNERAEREKAISTARDDAIAAFRDEHGLDDAVLEKLAKGVDDNAASRHEARQQKAELAKARTQLDALQARFAKRGDIIRKALVVDAILREAAGKFVDPQDAVDKLASHYRYDEDTDTVFIADDKGEPSALTIKDLVKKLLAEKPHLAKPTGTPGSGARVAVQPAAGNSISKALSADERKAMLRKVFANE